MRLRHEAERPAGASAAGSEPVGCGVMPTARHRPLGEKARLGCLEEETVQLVTCAGMNGREETCLSSAGEAWWDACGACLLVEMHGVDLMGCEMYDRLRAGLACLMCSMPLLICSS